MSTEKFKFFYGGPFSNWFQCQFVVDGKLYYTTEQHMMAEKARLFKDKDAEEAIMNTRDPEAAKRFGRKVRGFKKDIWDAKARDIVYKGCYAKFQQNKGLRQALEETKGMTLVEASPTDQIWGIGFGSDAPEAKDRSRWQGTNWLGEVLDAVREDFEQGIYRTENFCWNGLPQIANDVSIVNQSKDEIWIWDNDKMKRWAFDLKRLDDSITHVEVVVSDPVEKMGVKTYKTVTINCVKGDTTLTTKASAKETLTAFQSALQKMKEQISHLA